MKVTEGIMKWEKEQGWEGAWEGVRATKQGPQTPPVWHQTLPFPGEEGLQGALRAHLLSLQHPRSAPHPCSAVLPLCAHLGLEMSLEGHGPPSAPCPTLDVSPAQPFPFSSPKGPAEKEQSRAEGRAPQSPQPKLASAQSKTGASKPSPAPSRARNACPTQPGASGQTEQNKPNHAFHKINPLLLFL